MGIEFVNMICPNCKNPNYMVWLGDIFKEHKYRCMNCNRYFNDIDFDEPPQPVLPKECMNKKADMVEVIRCRDCKHAVLTTSGEAKYCKWWQGEEGGTYGGDPLYLDGNFYCAAGERR